MFPKFPSKSGEAIDAGSSMVSHTAATGSLNMGMSFSRMPCWGEFKGTPANVSTFLGASLTLYARPIWASIRQRWGGVAGFGGWLRLRPVAARSIQRLS